MSQLSSIQDLKFRVIFCKEILDILAGVKLQVNPGVTLTKKGTSLKKEPLVPLLPPLFCRGTILLLFLESMTFLYLLKTESSKYLVVFGRFKSGL